VRRTRYAPGVRLATITNWAYGVTLGLTLTSGATMLLASDALQKERAVVEQRHWLERATSDVGDDIFELSDHARQYLNAHDQADLALYRTERGQLRAVDERAASLAAAGATASELEIVKAAIAQADTLHDEQDQAIAAFDRGDEAQARTLLFGAQYERQLDQAEALLNRFRDRIDLRIEADVQRSGEWARLWKTLSEIALTITGLVFLCVLFFVFRLRVLRPVVKLSDIVTRLAEQDYAAELPKIGQIDEIGDITKAIEIFRDNGLERQRLEAQRHADEVMRDMLSRMTQRLQGCDSLSDLTRIVTRFAPEVVPSRAGRLYLIDERRNAVVEACNWLDPVHSQKEFAPTSCWGLRRGLPHRPASRAVDIPCEHLDLGACDTPDTLCLPLVAQGETLGLLYFEPVSDAGAPETPEIYVAMLAENISLALANFRLRDALRELALTDPLTSLANRRQLDAMLEEQLDKAYRSGQPISCLMLDVDHFKRFNDTFGHEAGDAVLREVGKLLRAAVRDPELAFRYGGEEFTLLLPGLDTDRAAERAEELRNRVANLQTSHGGTDLGPITISIGVACAPELCRFGRVLQAADGALLEAKARGRNRVAVAAAESKLTSLDRRRGAA
jgi:diguanylate cyclase (GGDEF)-like protein